MLASLSFTWRKRREPTRPSTGSRAARPASKPTLTLVGAAAEAYWQQRRDPEREQDKTLSKLAQAWLEYFPQGQRPVQLARQFPRIANRLALCWRDPQLAGSILFDLLVDKRGGRRGFPPEVSEELRRLRLMLGGFDAVDLDMHIWAPHHQATSMR